MNGKERISVYLLHYQAVNHLQEICDISWCYRCPYRMERGSTVFLDDGTSFTTGCSKRLLQKVFEHNISREV